MTRLTLNLQIDQDGEQKLLAMPINQTFGIRVGERHFTIVDTEFLKDLLKLAHVKFKPVEAGDDPVYSDG